MPRRRSPVREGWIWTHNIVLTFVVTVMVTFAWSALFWMPQSHTLVRVSIFEGLPDPTTRADPTPPPSCPECHVSSVKIMGTMRTNGAFTRQRYRFENVHLSSSDTLSVFLDPSVPLPEPYEVDSVHGNGHARRLPTELFYMQLAAPKRKILLNVDYRHSSPEFAFQECRRWEERPVFLLQVPHNTNIWHAWNDGLMGAYQTLRDEGLLPLAEIDARGNMQEYTADLDPEGCPPVLTPGTRESQRPPRPVACRPKVGVVTAKKCSPRRDKWCTEGLVAVNRTHGPIILRAKGTSPMNARWEIMLRAVSEDVRDWESEIGTCFKELYVAKSNTMNFYMAINGVEDPSPVNLAARDLRKRSMAGFQATMETIFMANRKKRKEQQWRGYRDIGMEVLRRGIGREDADALQALREVRRLSVIKDFGSTDEDKPEFLQAMSKSLQRVKRLVKELQASGKKPSVPANGRRVVTLMSRGDLRRSILNAADLLEYILFKYDNVTVRVTTLEEPLLETIQIMKETDVLVGMHGAAWTNGVFLRPDAVALQLFPYGWRSPGMKRPIRGYAYEEIVRARGCGYAEWVNPIAENAFMRRGDYTVLQKSGETDIEYSLHPRLEWPLPTTNQPGGHWIYQATVVDIEQWATAFDNVINDIGGTQFRR